MSGIKGEARPALIRASRAEFESAGFDGTNTNAIARRAGYAPQTFYRHFRDKLDIFLTVYEVWMAEELTSLGAAGSAAALAKAIVEHHRQSGIFRRAVRELTATEPRVAEARAASRARQLAFVAERDPGFAALAMVDQVAFLLKVERLSDALVEGEFARLGVPDAAVVDRIAQELDTVLLLRSAD
jgi:AcrR family transcriptional regulator